ncbi:hypothetical protein NQ317_016674 [Molorchus minor]|uniref:Uncharacterized protein n=1 Tax=Molorchus minor TaxID=1323400 RepID=A0ABQ9JP49_9CUCU|nr:hypothetical protein NQ317_016674 [Molorchus minor]
MNVNYHPVTLKKGTVLGYCCPVASIVRSLGTTRENSAEISAELEALIKTSSKHLKMDQRKMDGDPTWAEIARYFPVLKSYWAQWNSLDLNDGCLETRSGEWGG